MSIIYGGGKKQECTKSKHCSVCHDTPISCGETSHPCRRKRFSDNKQVSWGLFWDRLMEMLKMFAKKKKKSHLCSHTACFLTGKLNLLYIEVSVTTCDRATLKNNAQCWLEESCFEMCALSLSSRFAVSKWNHNNSNNDKCEKILELLSSHSASCG